MDITFESVNYIYQAHTPFESTALQDINFRIPSGSYTAIIGHTGSGKSTLLQHFNALLRPTSGTIIYDDYRMEGDVAPHILKSLRQSVGLVFQFPESQLFADTVLQDVMFGPQNFGASEDEAKAQAIAALEQVGIDEALYQRSPFELSGGQMRRVAIAGVLAMKPKVLVLDEPTAGLDIQGRQAMMDLFAQLHKQGMTIILVTHVMDDVAKYADHVLVMENGMLIKDTTPKDLFTQTQWLQQHHLDVPKVTAFAHQLQLHHYFIDTALPLTMDELVRMILQRKGC